MPTASLHESMRIAGERVDVTMPSTSSTPTTNEVVGTVPKGNAEHARRAFEIAAVIAPTLTRYDASRSCCGTAELLVAKRSDLGPHHRRESVSSKKDSLYEVGRAYDVFSLAGQLCILDDGEVFSCDITPHGKKRKIFTTRDPLTRHQRDHALQSSAQHGGAQDRAGHRHQQLRGAQAHRADAAHGPASRRHRSTRPGCRRRCSPWSPGCRRTSAMR